MAVNSGIFRPYDYPMFDGENIDFVKVGTDTLQNGYLVVADEIVGTYLDGYGGLYNPTKPAAITDANLAVVCAEEYYEDELGNRIDIDDPTVIQFTTGKRIRVLRPALNKKYFATNGLISGNLAVGAYVIPTASSYGFTIAEDLIDNPKLAFKIEEINVKDTFVGLQAQTGVRLRCVRALGE